MGIILERGSSDNVFIGWDESADRVKFATTSALQVHQQAT